jgi:hypothetical protein
LIHPAHGSVAATRVPWPGADPIGSVSPEAAAIAREAQDGILEFDAGLPRPEAEIEAARITATLPRNRRYLWASLRAALEGYPMLLAGARQAGPVDALPTA